MNPLSALGKQFEGLSGLPVSKQVSLILLTAACVVLLFGLLSWARKPVYQVLLTPGSDREAAAVVEALSRANIPYTIEAGSGAVRVPARQLSQAKMQLAGQGLASGGSTGFELLSDQGYGVSSFLEQARYNKAMEGELERSIVRMSGIASARVHLAVPRQSAFVRKPRAPSASVLLQAMPGRVLDEGIGVAVAQMVAASVPGLSLQQVTVTDQLGRLLAGGGVASSQLALSEAQLGYQQRLEETLARRIESMLVPVVGVDGVRAQVGATVDFSDSEQTEEHYSPEGRVVRSEQSDTKRQAGAAAAIGIPGALTNQPPGSRAGAATEAGKSPATVSQNRVTNYEVDRTVRHVKQGAGTLQRLSVAVLVDYLPATGGADKGEQAGQAGQPAPGGEAASTRQPLSDEQMSRIEQLVKQAVGFSAERGDTVTVTNIPFVRATVPEVTPIPLWQQPWLLDAARQLGAFLAVALLVLLVLRPLARALGQAATRPRPAAQPAAGELALAGAAEAGQGQAGQQAIASPQAGVAALPGAQGADPGQLQQLVRQDPRKASHVVRSWIGDAA